jgi:hypothetical protein
VTAGILKGIGVVALICIAALAGLAAWARMEASRSPEQVAELTGISAAILAGIEQGPSEARPRQQGRAYAGLREQSKVLLTKAPLLDAPLAFVALEAQELGQAANADHAFAAVLARSPRNAAARIWRAARAIEAGQVSAAVSELTVLMRLDPERRDAYIAALTELASSEDGAAAVGEWLATKPDYGDAVLAGLNARHPDLGQLLEFNRGLPALQAGLLARILNERGVQAAFLAWLTLLPPEEAVSLAWPYDRMFEGRPAPPPFNWGLRSELAEFERTGGLAVTYLGRGRTLFLDQTILLQPGDYRIAVTLSGEAKPDGGGFAWDLACLQTPETMLLELKTDSLTESGVTLEGDFTVPASECAAQILSLRGAPGEFPLRARARLQSVSIVSAATPRDAKPEPQDDPPAPPAETAP